MNVESRRNESCKSLTLEKYKPTNLDLGRPLSKSKNCNHSYICVSVFDFSLRSSEWHQLTCHQKLLYKHYHSVKFFRWNLQKCDLLKKESSMFCSLDIFLSDYKKMFDKIIHIFQLNLVLGFNFSDLEFV